MREKLIDVFMHLGDHISNRDEYGICFTSDFVKAVEDVLVMLKNQDANGVTVQKWIPVTERLPELWQDCFVVVKMKYDWEADYEYNVDAGCYVGENGYIDAFNTYNDWNEGQEYIHITHWMPLPEPPKENE
jgi:hypothetical protein